MHRSRRDKLVSYHFYTYFSFYIIFFLFKWLCWMVTLLQAVGLERITPKYIYFNECQNEEML